MRSLSLATVGLALACIANAADVTTSADKPADAWIAHFQRYAMQKNIELDYGSTLLPEGPDRVALRDVLRALPEPQFWPQLRRSLTDALSRTPAEKKDEQRALQAGSWLLAYLLNDRTALLADLKTVADREKDQHRSYALHQLWESVAGREEMKLSPEDLLRNFEANLAMFEPLDLAEVERILGGPENFAKLNRLVALGREIRTRFDEIQKEYELTKDEAAARAKAQTLEKEYAEKGINELQALAEYVKDPLVGKYVYSLYREKPDTVADPVIPTILVPDLMTIAGEERATALLLRALRLPVNLGLRPDEAEATHKLACKLALKEIDTLQTPSWGLVQGTDSTALFEALRKKFPATDLKDYEYRAACGHYLAGLIQHGKSAEAVKFVVGMGPRGESREHVDLPFDDAQKLEQTHALELWEFLRGWLSADPSVSEWHRFNRLSVQLGRRDELNALVRAMAADGAFKGMNRMAVQQLQANVEIATGDFEAGVKRLLAAIQMPGEAPRERSLQMDFAIRVLRLSDLRANRVDYASALKAAEALLEHGGTGFDENVSRASELTSALNELHDFSASARIGGGVLNRILENDKKPRTSEEEEEDLPDHDYAGLVGRQFQAEMELGHWENAHVLLQERPWWNAKDVSALLDRMLVPKGNTAGYYAALLAKARGETALARRILEAQLAKTPGKDSVYAAYLEVVGADALPLLEKLYASDRYEERPLIWKARLQMDAKQWDAAADTLQQAIAVDPSDGEEGPGDRMRVYAFMGQVMSARGDTEKAGFFANVVKSIRLSETADRWFEAGAYANAIELYRQALGFFQDAYCIQSRLAIRLADQGRMDEAAAHYRRAFELMPDSFGRVESHCFGCEHVFEGQKSQGVAEEVFARLLQARPDKPQLHYLTGYLREEQKRLPEAAAHYRRAVELDPLYLNAWDRLAALDGELKFDAAQRDELMLKLLELDPGRSHVHPSLDRVTDLEKLWKALKQADTVLGALPRADALQELKASAARLARDGDASALSPGPDFFRTDFASLLLEKDFVRSLQTFLATFNSAEDDNGGGPSIPKTTE